MGNPPNLNDAMRRGVSPRAPTSCQREQHLAVALYNASRGGAAFADRRPLAIIDYQMSLARISHQPSAAAADPLAVAGRTPSRRFDVGTTTPAASFSPFDPPPRRLDALATNAGEKCGVAPDTPPTRPSAGDPDSWRAAFAPEPTAEANFSRAVRFSLDSFFEAVWPKLGARSEMPLWPPLRAPAAPGRPPGQICRFAPRMALLRAYKPFKKSRL